ncbi:SDR family NAD(P)-dependent oxidoreductase [Virgibacillus oceani]|uniref:3-hydroxyacyl-CoA dehydrogenase n=1 Tax=Virgibacillus oceani TaxID=1479511 RepID=A0A917HT33_9BACI|nr:SDR family NAD(P)-dependent oxidoreductase [Virgibacillus oceani]GGG88438.1 3-hydroxyacyl-CoA dehydrogenase [Virgibacillus oceani]
MRLRDVQAIVTGGASGLGEATVRHIVENGGKAAIFDINDEKADRLMNELGKEQVLYMKTDVTNGGQVEDNTTKVADTFGNLNVLVNCAGVATPGKVISRKGPVDLSHFKKVIQVNLVGTFNAVRIAAANMKENEPNKDGERGVIVNTSSIAAFEGQIGQAAYSASKGGIASMTLPIAREFASFGVRVMAIAPGLFETPMFDTLPEAAKKSLGEMTPFPNRLGNPAEYAKLVESILTNPMLNGELIRLDGAIRMQPK